MTQVATCPNLHPFTPNIWKSDWNIFPPLPVFHHVFQWRFKTGNKCRKICVVPLPSTSGKWRFIMIYKNPLANINTYWWWGLLGRGITQFMTPKFNTRTIYDKYTYSKCWKLYTSICKHLRRNCSEPNNCPKTRCLGGSLFDQNSWIRPTYIYIYTWWLEERHDNSWGCCFLHFEAYETDY